MGVLRLVLGTSLLAGCQWALALKDYPARTDASASNPEGIVPPFCSGNAPAPALCADFDTPTIWLDGTESMLSLLGTNVVVTIGAPAHVGAGALHLVSLGGTYFNAYKPSAKMSTMTASFDIEIEQQANSATNAEFMRLTALNTSLSSCYVDFYLDQAIPTLRIQEACGSNFNTDFNTGAIPSDWFHVDFVLDLTVPRATIAINGNTHELQFGGTPIGPHQPQIELGIGVPGTDGLRVAYDQLVVTTTP